MYKRQVSVLCPGIVTTNIDSSERNRPGVAPETDRTVNVGLDRPEAMTPDAVADVVADAIETGRFWILPHEHYGPQAVDLAMTRVDGNPPILPEIR